MAQLVSEVYAGALFEVAIESNQLQALYDDYKAVVNLFKTEPDFFEIFKTPKITNDEKKQVMDSVLKEQVSIEMLNFLKILIDKRRAASVLAIFKAFEKMYRKHFNLATAVVRSVVPLTLEQSNALRTKLEYLTGYTIEIDNQIDQNLIGGMLIQIGDRIIDNSVKRKIGNLKDMLVERVV